MKNWSATQRTWILFFGTTSMLLVLIGSLCQHQLHLNKVRFGQQYASKQIKLKEAQYEQQIKLKELRLMKEIAENNKIIIMYRKKIDVLESIIRHISDNNKK